jgi:hypothetical protein
LYLPNNPAAINFFDSSFGKNGAGGLTPAEGRGRITGDVGRVREQIMTEIRYVLVCSDGTSYALAGRAPVMEWGKPRKPQYDLQDLLEEGWLPVRETGMGGGEHLAFALVLLQKPDIERGSAPDIRQ